MTRPIRSSLSASARPALLLIAVISVACSPGTSVGPGTASPTASGPPRGSALPSGSGSPPASSTGTAGSEPSVAASDPASSASPPSPSSSAPLTSGPSPATAAGWRRISEGDGPDARSDHTWTVDGDGGSAYLFGGRSDVGALGDLWRYDLASGIWEQLDPAGDRPSPRFGHVAAWVGGQGLVVWSGQQGNDFFNDLWAFDPGADAWRRLPDGGDVPDRRYGSCGAVGPDGRLWISHGFTDAGRFDDTRAYDFDAGAWSDTTPAGAHPIKRCLHDCLWTPDGRFLLYAGQTDGQPALGDLWALDPAAGAWTEQPQPTPDARQLYALATLGETAYIYGGRDSQGRVLDSAFTLDLDSLTWAPLEAGGELPSGRSGPVLIADAARGRLLLFGGTGRDGAMNDLWELTST